MWNNEVEDSLWKPFAADLDCSKLSEEDCKKESFYSAKSAACALLRYGETCSHGYPLPSSRGHAPPKPNRRHLSC